MKSNELCTFQKRLLIIVPTHELLLHSERDVRDQLVFHQYHSWCWSTLHVLPTMQWLQLSSPLQLQVWVYYQHNFVYLLPLLSAGNQSIKKCQFCWIVLQPWVPVIILMKTINQHSCLQQLFSKPNVTSIRCTMEAGEETITLFSLLILFKLWCKSKNKTVSGGNKLVYYQ